MANTTLIVVSVALPATCWAASGYFIQPLFTFAALVASVAAVAETIRRTRIASPCWRRLLRFGTVITLALLSMPASRLGEWLYVQGVYSRLPQYEKVVSRVRASDVLAKSKSYEVNSSGDLFERMTVKTTVDGELIIWFKPVHTIRRLIVFYSGPDLRQTDLLTFGTVTRIDEHWYCIR